MKLTDERIKELRNLSPEDDNQRIVDILWFARAIEREAYRNGQEAMRERAAERIESEHTWITREGASTLIRALEIEELR